MANTRDTMGEQACLDALVANTLSTLEDDAITKVGQSGLRHHSALTSVALPNCASVLSYCMDSCTNLVTADILGCGAVHTNAFNSCSKFKHLIMRGVTKTTGVSSMFSGTPLIVGEGAIYVQPSLLSEYKADSYWNKYLILPISAYPATTFETITDSWSDIITACGNGTYSTKYTVGDVKSITIDSQTYYMQLVAKDADVLASDGTTTVPTTWLMYRRGYTSHRMNSSASTSGMWSGCEMRSWLSSSVLPLLPAEVQSAIKTVRKYTGGNSGGTVSYDKTTDDKLWIPSYREVMGESTYETKGATYAPLTSGTDSRKRYDSSTSLTTTSWWLRSSTNATNYCYVGLVGSTSSAGATGANYVCFGFCI